MLKDSKHSERLPIGKPEVIKNITREEMLTAVYKILELEEGNIEELEKFYNNQKENIENVAKNNDENNYYEVALENVKVFETSVKSINNKDNIQNTLESLCKSFKTLTSIYLNLNSISSIISFFLLLKLFYYYLNLEE